MNTPELPDIPEECCDNRDVRNFIGDYVCISCGQSHTFCPIESYEVNNKKCCGNRDVRKNKAYYVCISCGQCQSQVFCPFESYTKKKSVHSRTRWFRNMLLDYVRDDNDKNILNADFMDLVRCYIQHNLSNGRNMSVYGYYIIRLAARRGIRLTKKPRDVESSKARQRKDSTLKKAYRLLGWSPGSVMMTHI